MHGLKRQVLRLGEENSRASWSSFAWENDSMHPEHLPPTARLAPGTRVGPWCVVGRHSQGSYGVVYRAVRGGLEGAGPVALKLALRPEDARFEREGVLLARVRHPAVPRLHESGRWPHPQGGLYPYLAMEWVEGLPLYEWADLHVPSSRQVLALLACLARALEATHLAGAVHRDVKGGNVLVRPQDGRLFLTDFGAGHYQGAAALTSQALPPGTAAYRSPEAWLGARTRAPYRPGPADDVFALGVTAWRLVTGDYPPTPHPADEDSLIWAPGGPGPAPARLVNPRCAPQLSALIGQMLHLDPQARGSARALAQSLEEAARLAGPEADEPLGLSPWPRGALPPRAQPPPSPPWPQPRPTASRGPLWQTAASLAFILVLAVLSHRREPLKPAAPPRPAPAPREAPDGGGAGIADAAVEAPEDVPPAPAAPQPLARAIPPKPLPGQLVPNAKGRCPTQMQVPINGGCWVRVLESQEQCTNVGYFEHQGACYHPVIPPTRPPVSSGTAGEAQP